MKEKVKNKPVSLNVDEATNNAGNKMLHIVGRFCDEGVVKTQLFAAIEENQAIAANIFADIELALDTLQINTSNVVSCLMDNCPTMRGCRKGVETLMRNKNPHLLNIDGDTAHIASNAAKQFCQPFGGYLEDVSKNIHYDIMEVSPKAKDIFTEMCTLLKKSPKSIIRPVESRFLQMTDVANRLHHLLGPLRVFYWSFLPDDERRIYQ